MTRKKFVKQLMAMGMDRNTAEVKAKIYTAQGIEYAAAVVIEKNYSETCDYYNSLLNRIADAIQPTIEAAHNIVKNMCDVINSIDFSALAACANQAIARAAELAKGEVLQNE